MNKPDRSRRGQWSMHAQRHSTPAEWLKLGRIQFAGFLFCVMLSGALAARNGHLGVADVGAIFLLSLLTSLWGFVHNDYCDARIDRRSPELSERPLVSGSVTPQTARTMIVVCILVSGCFVTVGHRGLWTSPVLAAAMALAALYNVLSKRVPGSDILFAASTALLCLLGALWIGGRQPAAGVPWSLVWTVVLIQFVEHIIFNAGATLKDVKNDQASSAVTMATFSGVAVGDGDALFVPLRFKAYLAALKLTSVVVALASPGWTVIAFTPGHVFLLTAAGAVSLFLTVYAVHLTTFDRSEIGRRWAMQEAAGKLLVPLLLLQTAGWQWGLFLILFPVGWFATWNFALYGKAFSLSKGF